MNVAPFEAGDVRGFLHEPQDGGGDGLVLTHGAGSDCRAAVLVRTAEAFCAAGVAVLRCDLPFRRARPSGPPRPAGAAADRAGLREAAEALRGLAPGRIFLGGHSYGGRQASMLAADEPELADALLLLSYPLHPPKQPEKLRTEHFPRLRTRCVFVHGAADPFATPDELQAAVALIPAETRIVRAPGAGHNLRRGVDFEQVVWAILSPSARAAV